ncbi:hypothetical protein BD324DRAFT_606505 [Kockovaella imperatae]|uniref:NAD(P)-binding protein n=1 Tax=Kockovaella imperatae TaxID=4999 RepID=A0A1Y1URI0_9TREE|nr:hypothetical protein BD324DRAFT_606505 [Kockovaella imperatae]ORX40650.1 hypothetical protein BD324DRAFT_606505 [Kockovaella imperatae]
MSAPPLTFYVEQFTSVPVPPTGALLEGKNVIITGANTGLGFETALAFAKMSPRKLIMTARNMKAGAEALDMVLKGAPGAKVDVWELDLASYASIKSFAARVEKELGTVDLLMNNAGVNLGAVKEAQMTEDGHELGLQTNTFAPILITLSLLDCLRKSTSPRVVFTTSEVHAWTDGKGIAKTAKEGNVIKGLDAISPVAGFPRYMETKLLLQMSVRNLIQALPDITIIAVNPGLCKTSFGRHFGRSWTSPSHWGTMLWMTVIARTGEAGARNLIHAAVGDFESVEYFTCAEPAASPSTFMPKATGLAVIKQYWGELLEEMEKARPGCTKSLQSLYP